MQKQQRKAKVARKPRAVKQPPIVKLFKARAAAFDKGTDKIRASIKGALAAIHEFMGFDTVEEHGGNLEWDDISYVEGDGGFLILIGVISFPPGTELPTSKGGKIKVTKDNAPYFRRLVRAGLAASVATKSKKEVLAYLQKMEDDEKKQAEVILASDDQDFDLSRLTEEQRKLYETSGLKPDSKQ